MRRVLTVSRHTCRVKSGKYLPWHSVISVNQYLAKARWDCNLKTHTALFFFSSQRNTRRGTESHFFSYMSQCQTLKPCTCCQRRWGEPSLFTQQKDKGHPFSSHPFFIAFFQLWISISVALKSTSWHRLKVLFASIVRGKSPLWCGHVIYVDSGIDYI